jgi:hypothetical protein
MVSVSSALLAPVTDEGPRACMRPSPMIRYEVQYGGVMQKCLLLREFSLPYTTALGPRQPILETDLALLRG